MRFFHPALFLLLCVLAPGLQGQTMQAKNAEHGQLIERLYPSPALKVLVKLETPQREYQEAVNQAYKEGVPTPILNELVALRALKNADKQSLQALLPILQANAEKYLPENSVFPDKTAARLAVKSIERVLMQDEQAPGALAKASQYAGEMAVARRIKIQLGMVDSLVDIAAIENNLNPGTPVEEAVWRAHQKPQTGFVAPPTDECGSAFGPQIVDTKPTVPKATYERFKNVVPDSFWAPFGVPK